jgi:hypothetical protein
MDYDIEESIGNRIGEFLVVDCLVNGLAIGKYLRVQVLLMITKPLMRGMPVGIAEENNLVLF